MGQGTLQQFNFLICKKPKVPANVAGCYSALGP